MSVHPDRTDEYRRKAEEARSEAARALDEGSKAAWLKVAEEWLRLADGLLQGRWRPEPIKIRIPPRTNED